jgi:spore germination protein Q
MTYNPYQYGGFYQPAGTFLPPQQMGGGQFGGGVAQNVPGMLPLEQSYVENILRLNKGKIATVYMTFERNSEWKSKIFKGVIEAAGRDHIILSDPTTGTRYILLMVYLDYITFEGEINYVPPSFPGAGGVGGAPGGGDGSGLTSYPSR